MANTFGATVLTASVCGVEAMAVLPVLVGKSHVRRLFGPRVPAQAPAVPAPAAPASGVTVPAVRALPAPMVPGFTGESREPSSRQPWLAELSPPAPLAQWASAFTDLRSCWNACRDPEWLLWLAARTSGSAEQQKQVVLCAAELASMAQRGVRETDPRVTRALSMVRLWAGSEADALDLFDAEYDAVDAARESGDAADREARSARALFRVAPRRRASSFGTSRALGAWQRWRENERGRWLALAAASAASATSLPGDATVTATEWADCVSQSAAFALLAMSAKRPSDERPSWGVRRRGLRLVRGRLACPEHGPAPAEPRSALDDARDNGNAGAGLDEAERQGGTESQQGDDAHPDVVDNGERARVAVGLQSQVEAAKGGDAVSEATVPEGDQRAAADTEMGRDADQDTAEQPGE
jgi:hypothetical protein